ncbi:hypothetical protein ABT294_46140 [Nonomuraea sp. NPDC000554]|uniref:hypothetical protein n=1 Tax=Nonomuraea sp. NPDC000554 TaxID=3154259 RepID=UPI0033223B64
MLTSKARRRLAQKTSALGIASTLVVFVGSVLAFSSPAEAAATKQFSYTCQSGGPISSTTISVGLSAPDSVAAGASFDLTVNVPILQLSPAPTAQTTLQVTQALTLTPTTVTVTDPGAKTGPSVASGATSTTAGDVKYKLSVPAGATGKVSVKPGTLTLALGTGTGSTTTTCTTTSTEVLDVTIGQGGGGTDTDIVKYNCTLATGTTDADYPAEVEIKVTMTPPTGAKANEDASIPWTGTIQSTGDPLKLPTSFPASSKLFATVKASGAGAPTSSTAEALLTGATAGQNLTSLPALTFKVKPTTTGTVSLTAGDLAFGTSSSAPAIKCTAPTTGLKTFTLTVGNGTSTPTPSNTTTTSTPKPTKTTTLIVTHTPSSKKTTKKSQTPKAGADTGGGGAAGPDGRTFMLVGSALVMAAGVGGLVLRRRNLGRG